MSHLHIMKEDDKEKARRKKGFNYILKGFALITTEDRARGYETIMYQKRLQDTG